MSHPDPKYPDRSDRDYGVRPRGSEPVKDKKAKSKAIKKFSGGIKGLKEMMNQPASKHWFNRLNK